MHNTFLFSVFIIFSGAAVLATLALYTRQSLLIAYILLGAIAGPGLGWIDNYEIITQIGDIGIIFLLFLLGLSLEPQSLIRSLRETTLLTLVSCLIFGVVGFAFAYFMAMNLTEMLILGTCMMFSSTIIGLKLLPTTVLHHQRMGELVISILLLQDIIAIFALLLIEGAGTGDGLSAMEVARVLLALPGLIIFSFLFEKYALMPVLKKFNKIHEYLFLVAIGWCLAIGQLADYLKVSFEIGAFIAGISLAASPVSRFIAESLKPLRDFFLILFFFALGASLELNAIQPVILPAVALAAIMLLLKPVVFKWLIDSFTEYRHKSFETGVRIGQISEFSLLLVYKAVSLHLISVECSLTVQLATIVTFMVSSYWILNRYPTPIAVSERLRRD